MKGYEFINSNYIRRYYEENDIELDPIQTAYMIWQCKKLTYAERHAAWNCLIDTTPDVPVPKRMNCLPFSSLHEMLREYRRFENKVLHMFLQDSDDAIYRFEFREGRLEPDISCPFASLELCKDSLRKYVESYPADFNTSNMKVFIEKLYISSSTDDSKWRIVFEYDEEVIIKRIHIVDLPYKDKQTKFTDSKVPCLTNRDLDMEIETFEGMYFDFDFPFEKGDVVYNPEQNEPFVLTSTVPWFRKERGTTEKFDKEGFGDSSDMGAVGYHVEDVESLLKGKAFFADVDSYTYMDLEPYEGTFDGEKVLLKLFSAFIKGAIDYRQFLEAGFFYVREIENEKHDVIPEWFVKQIDDRVTNKH